MKRLLYLIGLMGILLITGCKVKSFTMPTWDVILRLPMLNKSYFVSGLIDNVNFYPDDSNGIIFRTTGDIESQQVGDVSIDLDIDTGEVPILSGVQVRGAFPLSSNQTPHQLAYGLVSDGFIRYRFSSMSNTVTSAQVVFDEIYLPDESHLTIEYNGSQGWRQEILDGYHIGTANSNSIVDSVHFTLITQSSAPVLTPVGNIQLQLTDPLSFSTFRGRLVDFSIPMEENQTSITIEYPYGLEDALELQNGKIQLHLVNPLSFDCSIQGEFYAINNGTGHSAAIPLLDANNQPYVIQGGTGGADGITDIEFTNNVNQLLHVMPEHIELRNANLLIVNDNNAIGELQSTDRISGEYIATSPLSFILHPALITPRDTMEIRISSKNQETIRKNIESADLDMFVLNKLPVGAEADIYFSLNSQFDIHDSTTYAFSRKEVLTSYQNNPDEQPLELNLNNEELMLFTNPVVYMKMAFNFQATPGVVTITASPADFIRVRCMMTVLAHMEEQ